MSMELREKIGADMVEATKDPAVSARLNATAQVANPGGPKEFADAVERQRVQIAKIAQELGIKPKQ
jgi:tripartite-type tricarboxylate transporter receptor subunit TctC